MAKIDITKTELVWPGKYNEDGPRKEVPRVNLSFQLIETVNGSRATREAQQIKTMPLYGVYQGKEGDTFEEGWKNKLIWGDNLLVMSSIIHKLCSCQGHRHHWQRHISSLRCGGRLTWPKR